MCGGLILIQTGSDTCMYLFRVIVMHNWDFKSDGGKISLFEYCY